MEEKQHNVTTTSLGTFIQSKTHKEQCAFGVLLYLRVLRFLLLLIIQIFFYETSHNFWPLASSLALLQLYLTGLKQLQLSCSTFVLVSSFILSNWFGLACLPNLCLFTSVSCLREIHGFHSFSFLMPSFVKPITLLQAHISFLLFIASLLCSHQHFQLSPRIKLYW